jgi:hypothetical protein
MATHIGNAGSVEIGANTVAEMISWSLTENATTMDDTVAGDASQSHKTGTLSWSGSINCYWDETDTNGQEAMTVGASVALHLLPDGAVADDIDFNGTATIESIERAQANDAIVTANFTFKGNGDLTRTVLT